MREQTSSPNESLGSPDRVAVRKLTEQKVILLGGIFAQSDKGRGIL
jgi:hypothetical protein